MPLPDLLPPEMLPQGDAPLIRASRALARLETHVGTLLVAVIFGLMLLNIAARALHYPLIWTTELAVNLMVWLAFIGASLAIATKNHMTMGLLPETLPPRLAQVVTLLSDLLVLAFLAVMAWVIWTWLDLPGLVRAGSGQALAQASFNFIWTEPMLTLDARKIWFWLIMPVSTLCAVLHTVASISGDLVRLRGAAA